MYILRVVSLLLFGVCVNGITNFKHAIACEHNTLELNCEDNQGIDILDANYGRTSTSICATGDVRNLTCYQEDSVITVSDICEGKQDCSIQAKNEVFKDPCPGVFKYLFVLYRCVNITNYKTALACENKSVHLKCEPGKEIQIKYANYGRRSNSICSDGPIKTTNCLSPNSVDIVANTCANKRQCVIPAGNYIFGDPCVGTVKYLTVKYECVSESSSSNTSSDVQLDENNFNCVNASPISEDLVCNGFRDCPLGDDELICNYKSKLACEGRTLEIKCNKNEHIKIVGSNYGRLSNTICPKDKTSKNIGCKNFNSENILKKKCDGKSKCEIKSENKVFGDPCYGTFKYLEAHYECQPDSNDVHAINPRSV